MEVLSVTLLFLILSNVFGQRTQKYQCQLEGEADCLRHRLASLTSKVNILTDTIQRERLETQAEISQLKEQLKNCYNATKPFSPEWLSGGHRVQGSYNDIFKKVNESNTSTVLYSVTQSYRMSVVGGLLWVPLWRNNTILILSPNKSEKVREIPLKNISPRSLFQTGNNEVVLAGTTGLYVLHIQGSVQYDICQGYFTDLDKVNKTIVAYNKNNNSIVVVMSISGKWEIQTSFTASHSSNSTINSVQITNNIIYLSSYYRHVIHSYSLSGLYSKSFGVFGFTLAGSIYAPFLCGTNNQGELLVCDHHNHRLQVLSHGGQWRVYSIQGIIYPEQVLIDSTGNMWVLDGKNKITKFSV